METKVLEHTDNFIKFVISGVHVSIVNTLRRILLSSVPKMAIEDVEFHLGPIKDEEGKDYDSVTPLLDEIIAHRLGLIPLPTDFEDFNFRTQCTCKGEGCSSCRVRYALNKKGPCTVYSGDLQPVDDIKFKVKDELIPIVKLNENQAILVYAYAELGTAKEHAKWQSCFGVGYKYCPEIEINQKKCREVDPVVLDQCPPKILKKKNGEIAVENVESCILCQLCEKFLPQDAIKVCENKKKFIMHFETDGSITTKAALIYALDLLIKEFDDVKDGVPS